MKVSLFGRTYEIDPRDIPYAASKAGPALVRGALWSLSRLRRPTSLFLGKGVTIRAQRELHLGSGVSIGSGSTLDCSSKHGVTLGDGVTFREYAWIQCRSGLNERGHSLSVHENAYVGPFAVIGASGPVEIGESCQIGARFTVSAESHEADSTGDFTAGEVSSKGVRLGKKCWLGNDVKILDGVTLGDHCVVGPGAVVTKSFPAHSVIAGVPAKHLRNESMSRLVGESLVDASLRSEIGEISIGVS